MRTLTFIAVLLVMAACTRTEKKTHEQYTIEQFYQNTKIGGGAFSEDESKLLVSSNESGIFNLYEIDQLFSDINAFVTGDIDKGLFIVSGKLINGTSGKKAESAIQAQLNILSSKLVREEELQKVKNKIESNLIFSKLSILNKAMNLGYYEMLGDAERLNLEIENYRKVNRNQIREEASLLFAENKRNILFYEVDKNKE